MSQLSVGCVLFVGILIAIVAFGGELMVVCDFSPARLIEAKDVVFECGPNCGCGPGCVNRTSQRGLRYRLEVVFCISFLKFLYYTYLYIVYLDCICN